MASSGIDRRRALSLAGAAWIGSRTVAQAQSQHPAAPSSGNPPQASNAAEPHRLPADATTHHTLDLPGRTLRFDATVGAIHLTDAKDSPTAELAFVAFQLSGAEKPHRPVTFAFNGGPGFASAWLNVGVLGPWRIALGGEANAPSASPEPMANAETWLDFTDLVFIDPAGTGYSRILTSNDDARRRFWSVDGDIESLAEAVRRWLDKFDRNVSPKYLVGESYGGFRVPLLARELASNRGTGVSGLVLVSPKLDFGGMSAVFDPYSYVTRLPAMAAAFRAKQGSVTRSQLADVEQYARTEYLLDLTRGETDTSAIDRRSARVADFIGLDPALVRRHHGLISTDVFLHELDRAQGRVGSIYDATVTSADPAPLEPLSDYQDPVLEALKAPLSSAMVAICETRLNWRPERDYQLQNSGANRQWDWGRRIWSPPQAVEAMRTALALDPHLSVLIVHGLFDLITPYLETQLRIDQIAASGIASRIHLSVYPGGHMVYITDTSRAAFRNDAVAQFGWR